MTELGKTLSAGRDPILRTVPRPGDINVERRGRTSVAVRLDVIATRGQAREEVRVTSGLFTFVALDEDHRPRPLPSA